MSADPTKPNPNQERELFLSALEYPAAERSAFLKSACGADDQMFARLEALVGEHAEVGEFLEAPAIVPDKDTTPLGPGGTAIVSNASERIGDLIGRYKLLQKIGEGGCGVVYMAEQEQPVRRRVALKVIKLGMDTKNVIARFEAERQALAMMDHSHIARVFDAGATDTGRPYFVMELVRGIRITDYCDQNNLSTKERLQLFMVVCQAIQHAHQKGVIHRDIKPSNILVTLHDGVPVPKVIDFGIAKATEQRLTDKTLFTEFQAFIGTPAYMSPEQAEMSGLDIDTRSDIYSLGVLLYEMLTGKTPFDPEELIRSGLDACRRTIREQEPERPSTRVATLLGAELTTTALQRRTEAARLIHSLKGDLDWIVMKCLEKDRTRRYDTANDVAQDIQRYLDSEPVLARPPSNLYRLQKMYRKHRGVFTATATIAVTLVVGAGVSIWQAVRATKAEQEQSQLREKAEQESERAERENAAARLNEYVADINLAQQSLKDGNLGRTVQLLSKHLPSDGKPDLRGFEWRYLWQLAKGDAHETFPTQEGAAQSLTFSPAGDLLAINVRDQWFIWNYRSQTLITNLQNGGFGMGMRPGPMPGPPPGRNGPTNNAPTPFFWRGGSSLAFLPDGKTLVTSTPASIRVWHTTDWTEQKVLRDTSGPLAVSSDGAQLATVSKDFIGAPEVRVWSTADWQQTLHLPGASGPMAFSANGQKLVTATDSGITIWSLDGSGHKVVMENSTNLFIRLLPGMMLERTLVFSPDGKYVVAPRNTVTERGVYVLSIWDAETGREVGTMPKNAERIEHTSLISSLVFSPDGQTLATTSMDYSIRLWDFAKRERVTTLQGHLSEVWSLAFAPDGKTLVSGAKDGSVKIWTTQRQTKTSDLADAAFPLAFSPDGQALAAVTQAGAIQFVNLTTREPVQQIQLETMRGRFPAIAISADLRTIAQGVGGPDYPNGSAIKIWHLESGAIERLETGSHRPVESLALSPSGRHLITGGRDQAARWWDLRAGTNTLWAPDAEMFFFSPDEKTVVTFNRDRTAQLWDVATGTLRTNLVSEVQVGMAATFSPDSKTFAVTGMDDTIRLWNVTTGAYLGVCAGHKQPIFSIAFSPDGRTLASASDDSMLKFWNVATQQELLTDRKLGGGLFGLLFSPDGRMLVGGSSPLSRANELRFYLAPPVTDLSPLK